MLFCLIPLQVFAATVNETDFSPGQIDSSIQSSNNGAAIITTSTQGPTGSQTAQDSVDTSNGASAEFESTYATKDSTYVWHTETLTIHVGNWSADVVNYQKGLDFGTVSEVKSYDQVSSSVDSLAALFGVTANEVKHAIKTQPVSFTATIVLQKITDGNAIYLDTITSPWLVESICEGAVPGGYAATAKSEMKERWRTIAPPVTDIQAWITYTTGEPPSNGLIWPDIAAKITYHVRNNGPLADDVKITFGGGCYANRTITKSLASGATWAETQGDSYGWSDFNSNNKVCFNYRVHADPLTITDSNPGNNTASQQLCWGDIVLFNPDEGKCDAGLVH